MATKIITKNGSGTPASSALDTGEIAVDLTNKRLFTSTNGTDVVELGVNPTDMAALSVATDALFVDVGNKRLGVGTATPVTALHINQSAPRIRMTDTDGTNQYGEVFQEAQSLYLRTRNDTASGAVLIQRVTDSGATNKTQALFSANGDITLYQDDGATAALSLAAATGVTTLKSAVLTTADINGGTIDGTVIGATTPAAITGTDLYGDGGAAGTPCFSFTGNTNTGIYRVTTDTIGLTTGGTNRVSINSNGVQTNQITLGNGTSYNADKTLDDYEVGTWAPSYGGFTVGNGTVTAEYVKVGDLVSCSWVVTFGSTTSITGGTAIFVSLPFSANSEGSGAATFLDSGGSRYSAITRSSVNNMFIWWSKAGTASSDYTVTEFPSMTVPFSFTAGDTIELSYTYRAAP